MTDEKKDEKKDEKNLTFDKLERAPFSPEVKEAMRTVSNGMANMKRKVLAPVKVIIEPGLKFLVECVENPAAADEAEKAAAAQKGTDSKKK